jgi:hypothetical protein
MAVSERARLAVPCAACGKKHRKTLGWLRTHKQLACSCGGIIDIEAEKLLRSLGQADKTLAEFRRKLQGRLKKR